MTLTSKVKGVVQIFRPELPTAAGVCVLIGEVLALGAAPPLPALAFGFLCGFCLSGSALITNDYFDLEVDRINAPHRPLPAGLLTPAEVMGLGLLVGLAGLAAAWAFNPATLALSFIVWLMGFLYNWKLKAAGLWGNFIVAGSVAITFVLGGIGVGGSTGIAPSPGWNGLVWLFGLMAFTFDLAEEIAGDAMDADGDRKRGSHSIAIKSGRQTALRLSAGLFGGVVLLSLVPMVWGGLGINYWLPIGVMDVLVVVFGWKLLRSQTTSEGRWAMRALYISGSLGLLAFLVGALVG